MRFGDLLSLARALVDPKMQGALLDRATALMRLGKKLSILELARMAAHEDPRSLMMYCVRPHSRSLLRTRF
ncbi:hypothetical protein [Achromobacter aegrifaciens]